MLLSQSEQQREFAKTLDAKCLACLYSAFVVLQLYNERENIFNKYIQIFSRSERERGRERKKLRYNPSSMKSRILIRLSRDFCGNKVFLNKENATGDIIAVGKKHDGYGDGKNTVSYSVTISRDRYQRIQANANRGR